MQRRSQRTRDIVLLIMFAVIFSVQIKIIRGDFGEDMRQGSCLFWRLDCGQCK